ncbi:MAG: glycosyltransferase family 4 protein [Candidatus Vogelbacteria bacterium]|nr:glycosyltransferase family 4 protein [Candidatus Vogelbacteria bacterium]
MVSPISKPRVLIFSTAYFPFVGGAEIAIKEITDRLIDYDFDLITVNFGAEYLPIETVGRVTVYRVGRGTLGKFLLPIFGVIKAYKLNQIRKYNFLWAMMASQAGVTTAIYNKFFFQGRLLLTLQEGDEETHLARYVGGVSFLYRLLIKPWYLFVLKSATQVTVISHYLKSRAVTTGVNVPITVVPNGVNFEVFKPATNKFILDYKLVVTTSRLVEKNNIDTLIRAMVYLPSDVHLAIVGDGPDRGKLTKIIDELSLSDRVEIIGYLPQVDMLTFLRQADVYARVSRSEGLGNSFLEAMAVKVPVLASAVGGIVDFLDDGRTGWFADPNNSKDIAEKITYILQSSNKEVVQEVVEKAFIKVHQDYTWESVVLRLKPIFDLLTTNDSK